MLSTAKYTKAPGSTPPGRVQTQHSMMPRKKARFTYLEQVPIENCYRKSIERVTKAVKKQSHQHPRVFKGSHGIDCE